MAVPTAEAARSAARLTALGGAGAAGAECHTYGCVCAMGAMGCPTGGAALGCEWRATAVLALSAALHTHRRGALAGEHAHAAACLAPAAAVAAAARACGTRARPQRGTLGEQP